MTIITTERPVAKVGGRFSSIKSEIVDLSLPVIALTIMLAVVMSINGGPLDYLGLSLVFGSAVPLVFAALGQSFIIATGDIDFGMGFWLGLINCIGAVYLTKNLFVGIGLLVVALAAYVLQGVLVQLRGVPSIIVTLGASFVWLGLAQAIAPTPVAAQRGWLTDLFAYYPPLMPISLWLMCIAGVVVYFVYFRTSIGLAIRANGSNADAYSAMGHSQLKAKVAAYSMSGFFGIMAGLAATGATASGNAMSSSSFATLSIAAVILGGATFAGGKVSALGTVIGALVLSLVGSVMSQLSIPSNLQTGAEGLILILAIAGRKFLNDRSRA